MKKLYNKNIGFDSKLYARLYDNGQLEPLAIWCYIKCIKKHPFFKRYSTKKNKPQSISRVLSDASGLSYNTINKSLQFLLDLGLVKYDNNKVWLVGVQETTNIAMRLGYYPQQIFKQKNIVFRFNEENFSLSQIKTVVKTSILVTHKIASINKCLLFKETNATIKTAIDNNDHEFLTKKQNKKAIKKVISGNITIPQDDLNSIIPYCAISNKGFSNINGTKSVNAGFNLKRKLVKLGFIQERRKQYVVRKDVSYSEFLNMVSSHDGNKPLRYYRGTVYIDLPSEVASVKTNTPRYTNCYFSNALRNIVSIPALDINKDITIFNPVFAQKNEAVCIEPKTTIDLSYSPFVGFILKEETLEMCPDFYSSNRFKKAWYLKSEYKRGGNNFLLSRKDIKNRLGWSKKMIDLFLKNREGDKVKIGLNNRSYKLYSLDTISKIEQSPDFINNLSKNYKTIETWYLKTTESVA